MNFGNWDSAENSMSLRNINCNDSKKISRINDYKKNTDDSPEVDVIIKYNKANNHSSSDIIVISDSSDEDDNINKISTKYRVSKSKNPNYTGSDSPHDITSENENVFTGSVKNDNSMNYDTNDDENDENSYLKNKINKPVLIEKTISDQESIDDHQSIESNIHVTLPVKRTYSRYPSVSLDNNVNNKNNTPMETLEICDTDDEKDDLTIKNSNLINYKNLLFIDNYDSSDYDPFDTVFTKNRGKLNSKKIPSGKINQKCPNSTFNRDSIKTKSFLESLSSSVPMENTHQNAKKYKINFKNTKEELCRVLYKLYNEKIFDNRLPSDMSIEWNIRLRRSAGLCRNKKSTKTNGCITRSSTIVLASKILDSADRLRDTLIHEMCHAAVWLLDEVCHGHGAFWKAWASKAIKAFPDLPPIRRYHDYKISTKFTYRCTLCGYSIGRHSKSLDVKKKSCGYCFSKFELLINRVTKSGTTLQTPKTKKGPTGFALFVKENYDTFKKNVKVLHIKRSCK